KDPYDKGWLAKISTKDTGENLMSSDEYASYTADL
ncbi:MAG: glycine cleavage system protein H, partial [Oligoflexales bacterium]|nr:glycine cleavage system protein H [Oligoflexales bacterium]